MDWSLFGKLFAAILLAELGDKTQLAVIAAAAATKEKLAVFLAGSAALAVSTLVAVLVGAGIGTHPLIKKYGHLVAGVVFIVLGILFCAGGLKSAGAGVGGPQ